MGVSLFSRSSDGRRAAGTLLPTDPDPATFTIKRLIQVGTFVVGHVQYPNATNFEGNKVLVWENATVDDISQLEVIDPHFLENNSIIARFRPDANGIASAIRYCKLFTPG